MLLLAAAVTAEGEVPLEWNSGSNGFVYFVCNYLGGPLTQLPHVTPQQVSSKAAATCILAADRNPRPCHCCMPGPGFETAHCLKLILHAIL
jgi:hypothetical protein